MEHPKCNPQYLRYDIECAVYEYTGIQRIGKSTLMVRDIMRELITPEYEYKPQDVYVNFWLDIDGVNCLTNEQLLIVLLKAKKERWRHKIWGVDECSQPPLFYARNTSDKKQTELVTSLWQMPKLDNNFHYTSNVGNSVDVQQRDATWFTIAPFTKEINPLTGRLEAIRYYVGKNYDGWMNEEFFDQPALGLIQTLFDSKKPIT